MISAHYSEKGNGGFMRKMHFFAMVLALSFLNGASAALAGQLASSSYFEPQDGGRVLNNGLPNHVEFKKPGSQSYFKYDQKHRITEVTGGSPNVHIHYRKDGNLEASFASDIGRVKEILSGLDLDQYGVPKLIAMTLDNHPLTEMQLAHIASRDIKAQETINDVALQHHQDIKARSENSAN